MNLLKKVILGALLAVSCAAIAQSLRNLSTVTVTPLTVTSTAQTFGTVNSSKQYWQLQNNSGTGTVYLTFSGTAVSSSAIVVNPGYSWTMYPAPSGQFSAIGSIASNPNVILIEGQ